MTPGSISKPVSGSGSRRGYGQRGVRGVRPRRRYVLDYLDGTTPRTAHTTVQVHPGRDIPIVTLRAIERDLESQVRSATIPSPPGWSVRDVAGALVVESLLAEEPSGNSPVASARNPRRRRWRFWLPGFRRGSPGG